MARRRRCCSRTSDSLTPALYPQGQHPAFRVVNTGTPAANLGVGNAFVRAQLLQSRTSFDAFRQRLPEREVSPRCQFLLQILLMPASMREPCAQHAAPRQSCKLRGGPDWPLLLQQSAPPVLHSPMRCEVGGVKLHCFTLRPQP